MRKKLFYILIAILLFCSTDSRQADMPIPQFLSSNSSQLCTYNNSGVNNLSISQVKGKMPVRPRFVIRIKALNDYWLNIAMAQWQSPRLFPLPRATHSDCNAQFYYKFSFFALSLRGPPAAIV